MPGRKNKGVADRCIFPFHTFLSSAFSAGAAFLFVSPNGSLSARGLVEADAWALFRVRSLEFRLHPLSAVTASQAVGFVGAVQDTNPTTVAQIGELLSSAFLGGRETSPTDWVRVSKGDLAGPFPWYKTIPGTADPTEEACGVIALAGGTSDAYVLEIRGVFEFKDAVATANTPAAVQARQRIHQDRVSAALAKERAVLLKVLGSAPLVEATGVLQGRAPG